MGAVSEKISDLLHNECKTLRIAIRRAKRVKSVQAKEDCDRFKLLLTLSEACVVTEAEGRALVQKVRDDIRLAVMNLYSVILTDSYEREYARAKPLARCPWIRRLLVGELPGHIEGLLLTAKEHIDDLTEYSGQAVRYPSAEKAFQGADAALDQLSRELRPPFEGWRLSLFVGFLLAVISIVLGMAVERWILPHRERPTIGRALLIPVKGSQKLGPLAKVVKWA